MSNLQLSESNEKAPIWLSALKQVTHISPVIELLYVNVLAFNEDSVDNYITNYKNNNVFEISKKIEMALIVNGSYESDYDISINELIFCNKLSDEEQLKLWFDYKFNHDNYYILNFDSCTAYNELKIEYYEINKDTFKKCLLNYIPNVNILNDKKKNEIIELINDDIYYCEEEEPDYGEYLDGIFGILIK